MYKTEKLRQIGGFEDVKMGQEFYLMLRTIESGLKVGYLAECHVIAHRHGDGGFPTGLTRLMGNGDIPVQEEIFQHLHNKRGCLSGSGISR